MKRVAEDIDRDSKRPRHENCGVDSIAIFRDPIHEKTATELLEWTPSEPGYICGQICMKWPAIKDKHRIKMEMFSSADGLKQFEVAFHGPCGEALQRKGLVFKIGQELKLSLKGAAMEKASSRGINLPITLKYGDGVALAILPKGQEPEITIDTWFRVPVVDEPSEVASAADDWFTTPIQPRSPVLAAAPAALMDVDEEPTPVVVSPPSEQKAVSKLSVAPKTTSPLNNIRTSLPTFAPSSRPIQQNPTSLPPSSSPFSRPIKNPTSLPPSSSRPANTTPTTIAHPPAFSAPKENPSYNGPLNESASAPPRRVTRSPTVNNNNHASTSKLPNGPPTSVDLSSTRPLPLLKSVPADDSVGALEPEKILNKKQRKNQARREKRKQQKTADPLLGVPTVPASTAHVDAPSSAVRNETTPPAGPVVLSVVHTPQDRQPPYSPETKPTTPPSPPRPIVPHGFTPISGLEAAGGRWNVYSIIGIATYIKPAAKTKIGDWGCSLRIVDPSICDESYRPLKEGLVVNCFRRKHQEWLPDVCEGDVIILRDIKTLKNFDNITASGYWDKFQWAVYDSTEGQIKRPSLPDGVPKSGNLADGFGAFFTPFCDHTCTKDDLRYCVTLDEWWRGVQAKRREALGTIHQIEETSFVSSRPRRKHRLISELTTTGEYFDFTVRVVHGYPAGRTHRLFVTDGTRLEGGKPCQISECPPSFADRTLQIEMWDEACLEGPSMLPGEHYLIKNVRLKRSNDGYPEGKLVEAKIYKLERDDESPNLKALLERLQPYDNDDVEESKLKLIKDAEDKEFMSYVVELLHRDESLGAIYVTDYTAHPKIPAINEPWALGLDGRVLKIALFDEQPAMNQHLVVGQYYTILNLRLQASSTAQEFRGTLGGSGRFIIPINPKSSAVGDWKESLIQRKHQLKQQTESLTEIRPDIAPQRVEVSLPQKRPNCLSIKEVLASTKCPRTFFVRAKVVDFFPFKLNDSFKRTCANCNTFISDNRLACFKCDDVEKEYVKIVSILRFEINDGDQALQLSVSGNIPLLKGIEPTILHDDPEAARQFANRMRPLLHNLEAVHDGILSNEEIEPECPEMTLIIDNWEDADKKMMYGLRDYEA